MNAKITNFVKTTKGFISKHSPEILTGIGVTGMITSAVLAVRATPKALMLIEDAKVEKEDDLTRIEVVKVAWKPYIPAIATGIMSISCIIGASTINTKRNAALATAYAISEKTLLTYKDKVIETIGEKKEKEIREKVAQDEVDKKPVSGSQIIITSKGDTLCKDSITQRYFKSDMDTIKKAINNLNREINNRDYVSLNQFYSEIGLEGIPTGDRIGWNVSSGLIDVDFDACISEDGQPCIVVEHLELPKYDFDRMF